MRSDPRFPLRFRPDRNPFGRPLVLRTCRGSGRPHPRVAELGRCAVLACFVLVPRGVAAQSADEALVTDRPDFTESTASVAPGSVQAEAGYTFTRDGALEAHTIGELLLRIGVLPDLEARIAPGSYTRIEGAGEADGFGDAEVGFKWTLNEGAAGPAAPSAALLVATSLPTGDEEFGENGLQPALTLALAWAMSDRIALGSNVNAVYARDGGDRFAEWSGSLAVGIGVTERVGAFVEVFGFAPEDGDEHGAANGGLTYLVAPDLQLDARGGIGLEGPRPNYFAGVGFAWRR